MALLTRDRNPKPVESLGPLPDWKSDEAYQHARARVEALKAEERAAREGSQSLRSEIAALSAELDAAERAWLRGAIDERAVEELRARHRDLSSRLSVQGSGDALETLKTRRQAAERRLAVIEGDARAKTVPAIRAAHRAAAERLAAALRIASAANEELRAVREASGDWLVLPVDHWPELALLDSMRADEYNRHVDGMSKLSQWMRECRAAGYDVV